MNELIIDVEADLVGKGKERTCFVHPSEPEKAIKIVHGAVTKQTERELKFYGKLKRRKNVSYKQIPFYYGQIKTNLGTGHIFEMVRDFDGNVSKSLLWYLQNGYRLEDFEKRLKKLRKYLLKNQIIFNHDMYAGNILFQKKSASKGRLVVIDGLGDTVFFTVLNNFPKHRKSKIIRRWKFFINRLRERASKMKQ